INNGITATTIFLENYKLYNSSNTIALADRGNFFASVQAQDFYIGTRVKALILKQVINDKYILQFIATLINLEEFKYCYGRNACDRLDTTTIKLPVDAQGNPDWDYMRKFIKHTINQSSPKIKQALENKNQLAKPLLNHETPKLDTSAWKEFRYDEIFEISRGKLSSIGELSIGNISIVTATEKNNGITTFLDIQKNNTENSNCITVSNNGSIAKAFYQKNNFSATSDINILILKNKTMTPFIAMFLNTIIHTEKYRYNYGRKWGLDRMRDSIIKLPVDTRGNPDWDYMENYIKTLKYSSSI
ncbi:MAG: restriction endonuclease subunit S, partial [Brevinema sp.]